MDNHDPKSAPTQINSQTKHQQIIQLITQAIVLANISVYLGYAAIVCFCVFGTLASMATFKDSGVVYWAFHYLPYVRLVHANKFVPSVYFGTISYYPKEYFKDNFDDGGGAARICFCHDD